MICENVRSVRIGDVAKSVDAYLSLLNATTGSYERIGLCRTPCHLGGYRQWFLCPKCYERCGVLYALKAYACRKCHGLRYKAELDTLQNRAIQKCIKFRKRFGMTEGGTIAPFPDKPKRMRWDTYLKARKKDKQLRDAAWGYTAMRLNLPLK